MQISKRPKSLALLSFFALSAIEAAAGLIWLFHIPGSEKNAFKFGYSIYRLGLGGALGILALLFLGLTLLVGLRPAAAERMRSWLDHQCLQHERLLPALSTLWFLLALVLSLILLGQPAVMGGFFGRYWTAARVEFLLVVYQRVQTLLLWIAAFLAQALLFLYIVYRQAFRGGTAFSRASLVRSAIIIWVLYAVLSIVMRSIILSYFLPVYEFILDFNTAILIFMGARILLLQYFGDRDWFPTVSNYLIAALIFCVIFILYRFGTIFVALIDTPAKAYFNNLADVMIQGRLYLNNPDQTHDLTLYHGHWYVANPPLVAFLMVPWVFLGGFASLNTVVFSIIFSGLNGSLIFLLLQTIAKRGWTQLTTSGSLWLTAFLIFGTVHFYLGQIGKMWFLSQIVTITFVLLAVQIAVLKKPAWVSGAAIGLAMMARPNIPVILPILLGIDFQNARDANEKYTFRRFLRWAVLTLIPIFVAGLVLLGYNWARFDNILDYGYLTENVADFMSADLKNYGTFNAHFILRNLKVMFLALPKWSAYCQSYLPSVSGLSMLIVSPALVYLAGSFRRKPWVIGTWASILSVLFPLVLYYNTGAWQFGYKYFLDFSIPVVMLLAVAAGKKIPWPMRILILAGIVINIYGMLWFSGAVCRG